MRNWRFGLYGKNWWVTLKGALIHATNVGLEKRVCKWSFWEAPSYLGTQYSRWMGCEKPNQQKDPEVASFSYCYTLHIYYAA